MILYIQARRIAVALLTAACCFHPAAASEEAEREQFFTQKVLPLLKAHCYECHSHEADSSEGGLVLDTAADDQDTVVNDGFTRRWPQD